MSEYDVELFRERGFKRRECRLCGKAYWTLSDKETCGEPPCEEYSFIGNPPTKKAFTLSSMREKYLSFFEKHGHTRIPRYPIIARWRDDIFFTIASISCFQPWVLNGTIEPPANPLVMSQTCLRFNDIDNVGKTGRHLTEFEMMAHHAFNTEKKQVYFKDKTVELCHKLLLELGIAEDEVNYMEAEWSGGGNSGPCFEVIVRGVELATLVFMMYRDTPTGKEKMDMQVVDTGYGLERFVWVSQGTPNAYEAIFGSVLKKLKSEAKIQSNEKLISEYSKLAGIMNIESNADLMLLRKRVADRINVPMEKVIEAVVPLENIYAVCDHTRSLVFMLSDGGLVPSNTKGGYFARLLVRKSLRSLKALSLDIPLSEIVGMQIDYLKKDFPEVAENRGDILELISVEEKKYENTLTRGRSIVAKLDEETKSMGKDNIDLESLIQLYDSHGLTPEIVAEFSSLNVKIPDDFYIQVASRHERPEEEKEDTVLDLPDVAPTILGYYEDAYVSKFRAKILSIFGDYIILEKTYFYPEGGGQETDYGNIGPLEVFEVKKHGNVVVHRVRGDLSKVSEGSEVECRINWDRRIQLMQHHTGTHIINGAARRVLGNHAWQAGAHKSEELGRLDITHHSALTPAELEEIQRLSNDVIKENRKINISFMNRDYAEKRYGFRIYQGGAVPGKTIRIVDIVDWDVEACGGMHFKSTGEVGCIAITDAKRIQDGVIRLGFKSGRALDKYATYRKGLADKLDSRLSDDELEEIAKIFSVQVQQLPKTIERFRFEWIKQRDELKNIESALSQVTGKRYNLSEKYVNIPSCGVEAYRQLFEGWKAQRKDIDTLRKIMRDSIIDKLRNRLESDFIEVNGIHIVKEVVSGLDAKNIIEIAKAITRENSLLIIANKNDKKVNIVVCSNSGFNACEIAKKISSAVGGGAQGDAKLAVGGGSSEGIEEIIKNLRL